MRTQGMKLLAALTFLALVLAAQLGAFQTEPTIVMPLDTAYATFNQEGLRRLDNSVDTDGVLQVLSNNQESPQRIVLCVGNDIAAAVQASEVSFARADEPVPAISAAANDTLWLAAYLGSDGSLPSAFRLQAIEVTGKNVRVAYERDESPLRSADLRAYLIWVPLGRVAPGEYTLELFDAVTEDVTRASRWQVTVSDTARSR